MGIQVKYCKFCNKDKELNNFSTHKQCRDGLNNKCKQCIHDYRMIYNVINKKQIIKYNVKFNQTYNPQWAVRNPHIIKWRDLINRIMKYKGINKNKNTLSLLGYNHDQFKFHIESQFINNMNWGNIHIDHKIPLTWFVKNTPIKLINHLSNLQPLLSQHNISKLNKFSHNVDENYFNIIKPYVRKKYIKLIPKSFNPII